MVVKEFLDSDRVNFLIWRYLLEGNYRETAAKFQKEWHIKEPHRELPFAPHVKGHALVTVINRGLLYGGLEREHARNQLPKDIAADSEALQVGVFGPLDAQSTTKREQLPELNGRPQVERTETEESRKRALQQQQQRSVQQSSEQSLQETQLSNESPAKRPRLSNGYDHGGDHRHQGDEDAGAGADAVRDPETTPMDVDPPTDNNQAYPSPLEGDTASVEAVRTDGPEQGTQVEKVEELTPNTIFIRMAEGAGGPDDVRSSPAPLIQGENAPILLQCEWNPKDPSQLAGAGTDALARVWAISRTTVPAPGADHISPDHFALAEEEAPRSTTITALSWTSDGEKIAVATDLNGQASVVLWSKTGNQIGSLLLLEAPVIKLCWNPSNTALLCISPSKAGAVVTVSSTTVGNFMTHTLHGHDIVATPLDAAWISEEDFLLCGGDNLLNFKCSESGISHVGKFETNPDDCFTQVLFDAQSKLAATSSDKGTLDLWDGSGKRRSISAHQGAITTMAWQPLPATQPGNDEERLIATGGDDCAILIWNARIPESKPVTFLTMDSPIVRLAFTPDGAFLAGATASQVLIWKVGNYAMPRASWTRPSLPGWLSPKTSSEIEEEDEHCLSWDASGQRLAYGANNRLAVINFSG